MLWCNDSLLGKGACAECESAEGFGGCWDATAMAAFRSFLCALVDAPSREELVVTFVAETPLPPPGYTVSVALHTGSPLVLRRPAPNELPLLDLSLYRIFELLRPDIVASLVEALLLERRLVLHSRHASLLSATAEALVSLLWPLRLAAVYVPLLPYGLVDFCGAPMPFVLGIDSSVVLRAEAMCEPGTIFVDIDCGTYRAVEGCAATMRLYHTFRPWRGECNWAETSTS